MVEGITDRQGHSRAGSLWRIPGYLQWFTADTATAVGVALRALALSLVGYALTRSTVAAGWLGTGAAVAQQGLSVFGGTFVDRHDRRRLLIVNAAVSAVCWGAVTALLAAGRLTFVVLLVVSVADSAVNGFLGSASDAMLKTVVDTRSYPRARSLNEGRDAAVNMAGSPVGGFLYGIAPWLPFLCAAVMYVAAGLAAARIPGRLGRRDEDEAFGTAEAELEGASSLFHDFAEGWSWALHRRMLVLVMVAVSLANFGINGIQYAIQLHLVSAGVDSMLIGLVNSGVFLATLVGSLVAGRISDKARVGAVTCAGFVFMCAASVPMLFAGGYWALLVSNSVMCLPFPVIDALLLGFVFGKTPGRMQGRITVALTVPAQALSSFCSAAAGSLLPVCGFHGTVLVFWAVMVASTLLVACSRRLRSIPDAGHWDETPLE